MNIFVLICKSLLVLIVNIGFGYAISYAFYFLFFYPRNIYFFAKYHFYFSPGIVYKKKEQLLKYLNKWVVDYFECVKQDYRIKNFLTEYENKIFDEIYPFITDFIQNEWIPEFLENKINCTIAKIIKKGIRIFSRDILPQFLEEWGIFTKLDILDLKLDIKKLENLVNKYVYQYFLKFNLFFFTIIGLMNMLLFMILHSI
jgi:hypothetical protein